MKKKIEIITPYLNFSRKKWSSLYNSVSIILTENRILDLKKINKNLSLDEIKKIYLPLSNLLSVNIIAHLKRKTLIKNFLKIKEKKVPYIISIAGSVAVGKSTTASILKILLSSWTEHKNVELITTDSFLHSNDILKKRGLIDKKGFPQSYNIHSLVNFLSKIKSGIDNVTAPVYSHLYYDIMPNIKKVIKKPDILIIEGLNVLQPIIDYLHYSNYNFISDFVDFSIYVHASEKLLETWFVNRFLKLCQVALLKNNSYFNKYTRLSEKKATSTALHLWKKINFINLKKNILPTRERAGLIIIKTDNHIVKHIRLRK